MYNNGYNISRIRIPLSLTVEKAQANCVRAFKLIYTGYESSAHKSFPHGSKRPQLLHSDNYINKALLQKY